MVKEINFKRQMQKLLFPFFIFSSLLGIAGNIFGFFVFPFANFIFWGIAILLLELYLIILKNKPGMPTQKRKIILASLFIIPIISFSLLIWNEKRITPILLDPRINIVRIRISTGSSHWKNIYEKNQIIGFKNDISPTEDKWYEFLRSNRDKTLEGNKMNENLLLLYNYLKQNTIKNSSNSDINLSDYKQSVKLIMESDFETFRNNMINDFWNLDYKDNNELFKCIKVLWPQSEELTILKDRMPNTYYALLEIYTDLFRDVKPIFDIIIENSTESEIVIHSASLSMRNILFTEPAVGGPSGKTLDFSAEYNWDLNTFMDKTLQKWIKNDLGKLDLPVIYDKSIINSNFELDPPLIIQGGSSNRFIIRFTKGYYEQSEIRFNFYYREKKGVIYSNWYKLIPY